MQIGNRAMRKITALGLAVAGVAGVAYLAPSLKTDAAKAPRQLTAAAVAAEPAPPRRELTEAETKFYRDAASTAWTYISTNYQPATGLVNASADWHYTTTWDIGAQLLAFLSARDIGLITTADYETRVLKTLSTMERAALYDRAAYNKTYSATTGAAGDGKRGATGWSATDLGRLLVAAKIVSVRDPKLAPAVEKVVRRISMNQVVKDGYLNGRMIGSSGKPWTFQEGRIGYEQYAARGFALWGADVAKALAVATNAVPFQVLGVDLVADKRKLDRLTSEPFILYGLELGMPADVKSLAGSVLEVQQKRFEKTGQITVVSEDAVSVAPHYFYYYCIIANGKPFVVDIVTPGKALENPRWVSTKAAFGWHAIMPNDYTKLALDAVSNTRTDRGWASGVYEKNDKSTNTVDINTAAVILEAAAFQLRGGKPLIMP